MFSKTIKILIILDEDYVKTRVMTHCNLIMIIKSADTPLWSGSSTACNVDLFIKVQKVTFLKPI